MASDRNRTPGDAVAFDSAERLADANALLAEWAACSAEASAPLIDRLEALGYAVRGKSREAVAEVLKHPPTGPRRG